MHRGSHRAGFSLPSDELDRLKLRVRRNANVPIPREVTFGLLEALQTPDASALQIERIVLSDPVLAAAIIASSEASKLSTTEYQTLAVREAITRLGNRALKGIALGMSFRMDGPPNVLLFDRERYVRHSLAVGFVAKYLFARQFAQGIRCESFLSADELFTLGLLHDLGHVLLAAVAPDVYGHVALCAKAEHISVVTAFRQMFDEDLALLIPEFLCRWTRLPDLERALLALSEPWRHPREADALACLSSANLLVNDVLKITTEDWLLFGEIRGVPPELPEAEMTMLRGAVEDQIARCLTAFEVEQAGATADLKPPK